MSIFKDTLKPEVIAQLRARQQIISSDNSNTRNNQLIGYLSKNSWVKMTSLVNYDSYRNFEIKEDNTITINTNGLYSGDQLSKKYQLFGGTLYESRTSSSGSLRYGIDKTNASYGSNIDWNAYNNPGTVNRPFGIRPMPGIKEVSITNKSAYGSLREATVRFYCWDKHQLEELEILFMRPGYSVILEWGWSKYIDYSDVTAATLSGSLQDSRKSIVNPNNISVKSFPTTGIIDAFNPNLTQQLILDEVDKNIKKHKANCDGMLGYVKNFNWTLLDNGGYECTTTLISVGEVISSLKVSSNDAIGEDAFLDPDTPRQYQYTDYEKVLLGLKALSQTRNAGRFSDDADFTASGSYSDIDLNELNIISILSNLKNKFETRDKQRPNNLTTLTNIYKTSLSGSNEPFLKRVNSTGQEYLNVYNEYISFNSWLAIMDSYFTLKTDRNDAYVYFDIPEETFCLAARDSISIDPFVCYVDNVEAFPEIEYIYDAYRRQPNTGIRSRLLTRGNYIAKLKNFYDQNKKLGILQNIYINLDYLLSTFKSMNSSTSNDGVDVLSYIQNVLNGISNSLGGLNNFKVFVNNNVIRIGDTYYLEDPVNAKVNKKFQFDLVGLNSICRDVKITSRIFQEQSTMIAIGAQNKGNIGDIYSSTQTLFNAGLTDRIAANKTTSGNLDISHTAERIANGTDKLYNKLLLLATYIKKYVIGDQTLPFSPNTAYIIPYPKNPAASSATLRSILLQFNPEINFKALIPFELEITLDGMGGFVIGQIFTINKNILPKDYYNKNLGFIITGISHNLSRNDWTTTLKTQICLLDDETGFIDNNLKVLNGALVKARRERVFQQIQTFDRQALNYAILRDFILYQANRSLVSYMFADMSDGIANVSWNGDVARISRGTNGRYSYRYGSFEKFINAVNNTEGLQYYDDPEGNAGDFVTKIGNTNIQEWYPAKFAEIGGGINSGQYADGYGYTQFAFDWLDSLRNNSSNLNQPISSTTSETLGDIIDNYFIEANYYLASDYSNTTYIDSNGNTVQFQYFRPDFYLSSIKDQIAPPIPNSSLLTPNNGSNIWKNTFRDFSWWSDQKYYNIEYDQVVNNIDNFLETQSSGSFSLRILQNQFYEFSNRLNGITVRNNTDSPVWKDYDVKFKKEEVEIAGTEATPSRTEYEIYLNNSTEVLNHYQLTDTGNTGAAKRSSYSHRRVN